MGDHMIKEYVPATATDILQRQSINSLLGNAGHASPQEGDTLTSISDLFGLNNPRGSMFSSYGSPMQQQQQSSGQLGTPPTPPSLGYNQQMPNFRPDSPLTAQKSPYYCGWADTPQSSPATPPHYGTNQHELRAQLGMTPAQFEILQRQIFSKLDARPQINHSSVSTDLTHQSVEYIPYVRNADYDLTSFRSLYGQRPWSLAEVDAKDEATGTTPTYQANDNNTRNSLTSEANNNFGDTIHSHVNDFRNIFSGINLDDFRSALQISDAGDCANNNNACGVTLPSAENDSENNDIKNNNSDTASSNKTTKSRPHVHNPNCSLDREARFHRVSATLYDATCTWSGVLSKRTHLIRTTEFSTKVFIGGIPWDATEEIIIDTFRQIGRVQVIWPGKDKRTLQPRGHVYLIFESQRQVKDLLSRCTGEMKTDGEYKWFCTFWINNMNYKPIQVIPWAFADSTFMTMNPNAGPDTNRTVFVGALHGTLNAEGLAKIMNDLFDGVVYAGLDTDKYRYPMGSGRVTFNNEHSYARAVNAAFINVKTNKFTKKIQVDPYLEDAMCWLCKESRGLYFCRDVSCFQYFCCFCWKKYHEDKTDHKPIARHFKTLP